MKIALFKDRLGEEWTKEFTPFIESEEMDKIYTRLKADSVKGETIYPTSENTFKAFKLVPPSKLRLIVIGQDPYPGQYYKSKAPHATGLALDNSNMEGNKLQPSLEAFWEGIAKEYNLDYNEFYKTHNLSFLAEQGVLLANRAMTVCKGKVNSHMKLWDGWWKYFFEDIMRYHPNIPVLFLGNDAEYVKRWIFEMTHPIFKLSHPSAAAKNNEDWETNGTFEKINTYLQSHDKGVINWSHQIWADKKAGKYGEFIRDTMLPF